MPRWVPQMRRCERGRARCAVHLLDHLLEDEPMVKRRHVRRAMVRFETERRERLHHAPYALELGLFLHVTTVADTGRARGR